MRIFSRNLFFFLIPFLVVAIGLEIYLRSFQNEYKLKKSMFDTKAPMVETLILGNSHTFTGIHPQYLKGETYNLAFAAQTLKYDLALLDLYKDELASLKNIIVPISYFTLYSNLELNPTQKFRIKFYKITFGLYTFEHPFYNLEILSSKFSRNIAVAKDSIFNSEKSNKDIIHYKGWASKNYTIDNIEKEGRDKALIHESYVEDNQLSPNIEYLVRLIKFAERQKANIYFVTVPAYQSYHKELNIQYLEKSDRILDSLVGQTYNVHVSYHNFLKDKRFQRNDFVDSDHLNVNGATKFSKIVDSLLIR